MDIYFTYTQELIFDFLPSVYIPKNMGFTHHQIVTLNQLKDGLFSPYPYNVTEYYHWAEVTYGEKVYYTGGFQSIEL
jgi:hypothetical protein